MLTSLELQNLAIFLQHVDRELPMPPVFTANMKTAVLSLVVSAAAAFAPAAQQTRSTVLQEHPYAKEVGAQAPVSATILPHILH